MEKEKDDRFFNFLKNQLQSNFFNPKKLAFQLIPQNWYF